MWSEVCKMSCKPMHCCTIFQVFSTLYLHCCLSYHDFGSVYFQCGTLYLRWLGESVECEETPAWEWEAPLFCGFQEKRQDSQGDRYVWEEDPCQMHGTSLIWRQVFFWWVHKQFTSSLEVVHFTRLFKDLWHLRRASEANNPTFRMWVFPLRSIPDRNIKWNCCFKTFFFFFYKPPSSPYKNHLLDGIRQASKSVITTGKTGLLDFRQNLEYFPPIEACS